MVQAYILTIVIAGFCVSLFFLLRSSLLTHFRQTPEAEVFVMLKEIVGPKSKSKSSVTVQAFHWSIPACFLFIKGNLYLIWNNFTDYFLKHIISGIFFQGALPSIVQTFFSKLQLNPNFGHQPLFMRPKKGCLKAQILILGRLTHIWHLSNVQSIRKTRESQSCTVSPQITIWLEQSKNINKMSNIGV